MNKTEERFSHILEAQRLAGEILWWKYEAITFKLAHDTRYTPDFLVMYKDGTMECVEVKGWLRDDAAVKIKVAAQMFPFVFRMMREIKGRWEEHVY